jgi:hypothetical protein
VEIVTLPEVQKSKKKQHAVPSCQQTGKNVRIQTIVMDLFMKSRMMVDYSYWLLGISFRLLAISELQGAI